MNHAITMGIFLAFNRRRQCRLFLCPFQEGETLVVGNHVVDRRDCFSANSAVGDKRHAAARFLGLLSLI